LLQRQNLRQLSQRVTARYHLVPLNQEETQAYLRHRMQVAGAQRNPFRRSAMRALYQRSAGVPRLINIIADRALAGAYARESLNVSPAMVHAAANEVQPSETRVRSNRWPMAVATVSIAFLLFASLLIWDSAPLRDLLRAPGGETKTVSNQPEIPVAPAARQDSPEQAVVTAEEELPVGAYAEEPALTPAPSLKMDAAWLDDQHQRVWESLADLWQDRINANAIQLACDGIRGTGYACLRDQGNWSRIRQLGLPVILVLQKSETRLLVLSGFSPDALLLGAAGEVREVARDDVEQYWFGEFIIAWPQAPDWPSEIRRGESGAAVDIVMEMAAAADPAWQGGGVFDSGFESWLMTFQRRNGLKADGIVGPNTLIYLMAPTITQPRLILAAGGRS
jgi:general secretion pathway protein A